MTMGNYTPDTSGLAQIGSSSAMQAACEAAAERGASYARSAAPGGSYTVEARTVTAGYKNESRAGAALVNSSSDPLSPDQLAALDAAVPIIES